MIPICQINVLNPRTRNTMIFQSIISNIAHIGLKKPITVARRPEADGKSFELVCGQGRLEAFIALGQTEIPAIITEASREECYLMSLENIARKYHSPAELLREIGALKSRGYGIMEIAKKIDVTHSYVSGIIHLLEKAKSGWWLLLNVAACRCRSPSRLRQPTRQASNALFAMPTRTSRCGVQNCLPSGGLSRIERRMAKSQCVVRVRL